MSGSTVANVSQLIPRSNATGTRIVGYDPIADTFVVITPGALTGQTGPQGPVGPAGPTGAQGTPGSPGTNGRTVLNGTGVPAASLGANGDFYIDVSAWRIHGPKTNGAWPAGVNLVGPQGPAGPAGTGGGSGLPSGGTDGQILVSQGGVGTWQTGTSIVADRTPTVSINTPTALTFAAHNRRRVILKAAANLTLAVSEVNASGGSGMEFSVSNRHTAINQITFGAGITVLQPSSGTGTGGIVKIAPGSASLASAIAVDIYADGADRIAEIHGNVA